MCREYTYEAGCATWNARSRRSAASWRGVWRRAARSSSASRRKASTSTSPPLYIPPLAEEEDEIGVATGLAWTEAGGDIMAIEVTLMPGKGLLLLTGQLGEVMQESAQAAQSYTRSQAGKFAIDPDEFDRVDIHVHLPEGAIQGWPICRYHARYLP